MRAKEDMRTEEISMVSNLAIESAQDQCNCHPVDEATVDSEAALKLPISELLIRTKGFQIAP